jgi:hypothetical protein
LNYADNHDGEEVFEPIVGDQDMIIQKLTYLEELRNAIARTRTLSAERKTVLQYLDEVH